ncbi:MAG: DJ-1/PfpI family protein [Actinomycetota bacterium]|nr:DJ-1/PfpI family protein [Actinomycetota bacterium]
MLRIAVALFPNAEELDWAGPWEVLGAWARLWPDDDVEVFTVAEEPGPIRCANGLTVHADRSWADAGPIDVVVYPGGAGTRAQLGSESVRARMRSLAGSTQIMAAVCTGSLVFADAGLLDGRPATTHWASLDDLASLGQAVEVRPEDRFVDDGDIVTAAGVSAGIDMALHLVARLHSVERARDIRRVIQYDPDPPV